MKILDEQENLWEVLSSFSNRKITIVTAFVSKTSGEVEELIKQNNTVELILGSINAFSPPSFIEKIATLNSSQCTLYVDFRYENSTHWKLYLIEPNIVIIGSANFTKAGLDLHRDTCIHTENAELYREYMDKVKDLTQKKEVLKTDEPSFAAAFSEYKRKHKKFRKQYENVNLPSSIAKWLWSEDSQSIPIFVWCNYHGRDSIETASKIVKEEKAEQNVELDASKELRDFFTLEKGEEIFPYKEGDTVLCMNHNGAYIGFYTFDSIVEDDGVMYMLSFKKADRKYKRPFNLSAQLRMNLKAKARQLHEKGTIELNREQIIELAQ